MSSAPDPQAYLVRRADWASDREALRLVRLSVFVQEQAVPEELEWDGEDNGALHILALDGSGRPIGTARLMPTGQIGRMAVLQNWRGRGVGSALLRELLAMAFDGSYPDPFLNAQISALPFYLHAGFVPIGDEFEEAGIRHRRMVFFRAKQMPTNDLSTRVLSKTRGSVTLPDQASLRAASVHMALQAKSEIALLSHDLDAPLYDFNDFLASVHRLAMYGGPRLPVRILLFDAEPAVRKGHRLIELARHHSSHIQIRQVPPEFYQHTEAYLLADRRGYVLRPLADVFEGTADYDAPLIVRRLHAQFDHIWELGDIPLELRRLQI